MTSWSPGATTAIPASGRGSNAPSTTATCLRRPIRGYWPRYLTTFAYGIAVQAASGVDRDELQEMADAALRNWPEVAAGADPAVARNRARLGLATVRGLLLDLLATGDRAGVNAAMEDFLQLYYGSK